MVIRRKDTATVWIGRLNFCEVEVFSCPPGKWGVNATDPAADCSGSCKCKPEETCSVATGRNSDCLSAECSAGWWGENCEKTCHCARKCHRNTGYCDEAGCAQGYAGPLNCNTGMSTSILNLFSTVHSWAYFSSISPLEVALIPRAQTLFFPNLFKELFKFKQKNP